MEYFNFEDLVGDLKNLNEEQKYWMVRTMGGAYYGEFIRGNYIAVGYNNISLGDYNTYQKQIMQPKKF